MAQKIVRFFEPVHTNSLGRSVSISGDFWEELLTRVESLDLSERESNINDVSYVGEARHPKSPVMPHLQLHRIRNLSEQINEFDKIDGLISPLHLDSPSKRIAEPTYLVPFGKENFVAILSPAPRGTHLSAIEEWLTHATGIGAADGTVTLRPIIDESIMQKLQNAQGGSRLELRVERGTNLPTDGGGEIGDALRQISRGTTEDMSLDLTWSFGYDKQPSSWRKKLVNAATWIAQTAWTDKAKINFTYLGEDGELHTETHDIFRDRVAINIQIESNVDERLEESYVLHAISSAIQQFNSRMS